MKVCIVSDSHDRGPMLARAIEAGIAEGAEAVIHCGDVIGGNTLRASLKLGVPIHAVHAHPGEEPNGGEFDAEIAEPGGEGAAGQQ